MPRPSPPGQGIATTGDERPQPPGLASGEEVLPIAGPGLAAPAPVVSLASPGLAAGFMVERVLPVGIAIAVEYIPETFSFFLKMDGDNLLLMSGDDLLLVN